MAIAQNFVFQRPNTAQDYDSFEKSYKGGADMPRSVLGTTPALASALPQTIAAAVQSYVSADRFADSVICSGTLLKIGDTWGVLMNDAIAATEVAYATNGVFSLLCTAGGTFTKGIDLYVVVATAKLTETAGAGADYLGKCLEVEVNPVGRPAGTYCILDINQTEL